MEKWWVFESTNLFADSSTITLVGPTCFRISAPRIFIMPLRTTHAPEELWDWGSSKPSWSTSRKVCSWSEGIFLAITCIKNLITKLMNIQTYCWYITHFLNWYIKLKLFSYFIFTASLQFVLYTAVGTVNVYLEVVTSCYQLILYFCP